MLNLMLWGFGLSMKTMYATASIMDASFKKRLKERDIHILIKTMDGKTARTISLQGGKIVSKGKAHPDPDICVAFSSLKDMMSIMFAIAPKFIVKAGIDAFRDDKLKINFKVEPFAWTTATFMQMLLVYCDRSRPKKFLFINA